MKKLLILLVLLLTGCVNEVAEQERERAETVTYYQTELLANMKKFKVQYEDTEWEPLDYKIMGTANWTAYSNEAVKLFHATPQYVIMIDITFEEASRTQASISMYDIYYISYIDSIYINVELYHYNTPFKRDYVGEKVSINYVELSKALTLFTTEELKFFFHELGYTEVNYGG
jgi:hypothetical protein